MAKGADRAIHIEEDDLGAFDTLSLARLLAAAAESEAPDLILTGLQSDDLGGGQTGVVMAELAGLPHATIIMAVEIDGAGLRVKRELENGFFQYVSMPLPAVLTIQSGLNKLRYATLMGIKKGRSREVRRCTAAGLGVTPQRSVVLQRLPSRDAISRRRCWLAHRPSRRRNWWRNSGLKCEGAMSGILVITEQTAGAWHKMSFETSPAASSWAVTSRYPHALRLRRGAGWRAGPV